MILYLYVVWSKVIIKQNMEEAVEEILICTIIASGSLVYGKSMKTRKRKRKYWVRDYFREGDRYGAYKLTLELRLNDPYLKWSLSLSETCDWDPISLFTSCPNSQSLTSFGEGTLSLKQIQYIHRMIYYIRS